jgi:hypothetical protein
VDEDKKQQHENTKEWKYEKEMISVFFAFSLYRAFVFQFYKLVTTNHCPRV